MGAVRFSQEVGVEPLGDMAILVRFGNTWNPAVHEQVRSFCALVEQARLDGVVEWIPAYVTVAIVYDPMRVTVDVLTGAIRTLLRDLETASGNHSPSRIVTVPVCYGGAFGPDLPFVSAHTGLSEDEVIQMHSEGDYVVTMVGFAPGYPYIAGLSARLHVPRKSTPRTQVPAGSVAIAGGQTGIYPLSTPGGWQIIGRTPLPLFDVQAKPPSLLQMGDEVRFRPISFQEFEAWDAAGWPVARNV